MGLSTYIIDPNRSQEMRSLLIQLNRIMFFILLPLSVLAVIFQFLSTVSAYLPRLTVKNVLALKTEELYAQRGGTEPIEAVVAAEYKEENDSSNS